MDEIPNKIDNGLNSVAATDSPLAPTPLGITENSFRTIREILLTKYDCLDVIEFVMEYERKTGAHIPDHWLRD